MKNSLVQTKAKEFAFKSIDLYKELISNKEFILSKQFLKSSTSIGANIQEALSSFSKKDFTYKMSIAAKEAREPIYWLELIEYSSYSVGPLNEIKDSAIELSKILYSIVKSSKSENR